MTALWIALASVGLVGTVTLTGILYRQRRLGVSARASLAGRSATVDRLLDFSQTIQGAGKSDQVFSSLCHYLQSELNLSGLTVLTYDTESSPALQVRASWPADLVCADRPVC